MPTNPPLDLLPRLIALAMAEEPVTLCAECDGPCKFNDPCYCDNDTQCEKCEHMACHYQERVLAEAVGSLLWNNKELHQFDKKLLLQSAVLKAEAIKTNVHANVEPRHLAALWEACAEMIADAEEKRG